MAYGGAGLCPDFVLRAKKCKITAKIGKKLKKIQGQLNFTMDQFFFRVKNPKNIIFYVIPYIGISDL
jgi:hypothetical protein